MASAIAKTYLLLYNFIQALLWYHAFFHFLHHFFPNFPKPFALSPSLSLSVPSQLPQSIIFAQYLAFLEILHPFIGLSRGNPILSIIQISGRNIILFLIILPLSDFLLNNRVGYVAVFLVMIAWTLVEIIRYPFYILTLYNDHVKVNAEDNKEEGIMQKILIWLRYSVFVPLYPLGFVGEWLCYYTALPVVKERRMWSVNLPNHWNFAFDFSWFIRFLLLMYAPVVPVLFLSMWRQRQKKLGSAGRSRKKKE